ncbi:dehydratase [Evansella sp. LMS18]|jgi:acyl dehydratase|uniref:MaoC/PaaZ C-terminal domain-containing protein n=1 Tax=Evansella sp. LMS18 TaxID=2924033 RepID=UPI0020D0500B|nr:MaoC/PaaZ C-terminal domain-containing protein [Evansella sp. LMS18]UTR11916.1 dehydratase [Evansella sp. LMS18]
MHNNRTVRNDSLLEKEIHLPPVTQEQLIQYAGASTDFNPIHTIEKRAQEFGLPGVIAHGMLTMAFMGKAFSPFVEKGAFLQDFHSRFKAKVFEGDSITIWTEQTLDPGSKKDETLFHFKISAVNQHGKEVAEGSASLNLSCVKDKELISFFIEQEDILCQTEKK